MTYSFTFDYSDGELVCDRCPLSWYLRGVDGLTCVALDRTVYGTNYRHDDCPLKKVEK